MSHPLPQKTLSLKNRVRFVTATSLFDGHDAAINIISPAMHGYLEPAQAAQQMKDELQSKLQ